MIKCDRVGCFKHEMGHLQARNTPNTQLTHPSYSGLRVDGTDPNVGALDRPPSNEHHGVCAIYSETTVSMYTQM